MLCYELQQSGLKRPNHIPFIKSGWHTDGKEAWDAYIWVNNVETLYTEYLNKKINIIKEIQETEYNNREFEIKDLDGYILCFGQYI